MINCACPAHQICCSCPLRLSESALTTGIEIVQPQSKRNMRHYGGETTGCRPIRTSSKQAVSNPKLSPVRTLPINESNIDNLVNKHLPRQSLTNHLNMTGATGGHHQRNLSLRQQYQFKYLHSSHHHHFEPNRLSLSNVAIGIIIMFMLILSAHAQAETSSYLFQGQNVPSSAVAPPSHLSTLDYNQPTGPSMCPLVTACQCKWSSGKQGASCEKRNLITIPSNLPQDTQVLEMNGNPLNQLADHVFLDKHLTNLQKIFLSDCKISHVADQAFVHLTNLIELDLSHNSIMQVPIRSFERLNHSLRKLNLAYNPIQSIEPDTFNSLTQLNTLDLSYCQISQLKPGAFHGLGQLKELKLVENRLTQLPMSVIKDLSHEYLTMELFSNPWHCDCELKQSIDLMSRNRVQISVWPSCATPAKHKEIRWINVRQEDFLCPPTVISKQNELTVGAGSNVSLACQARGSQPLTFVWFQDEKNLTTNFPNATEQPASTKLLEDKRYEIAEEIGQNITTSWLYLYNLQLSDTSLFLCWVENAAGYSHANFSLIVNNDTPPANIHGVFGASNYPPATHSTSGNESIWGRLSQGVMDSIGITAGDAQLGIVSIVFVVVLVAAILFLLMFKHNGRSSKSSQSSDLKPSKSNGNGPRMATISTITGAAANGKFASNGNLHQRSMLAESDEYDDSDDQYSDNSSSSCRKNTRPDYDGFIEHMRTGIINIDYHSMSPVGQFNNSSNIPVVSQQHQNLQQLNQRMLPVNHLPPHQHQQPFMGTNQRAMHHFPSASNASSVPPYYGSGNGSASMATTTSDLSPGSGNANFANNGGPTTNCDSQQQFNEMSAPPTNTATTSYTSDYQSGYGGGGGGARLDELPDMTNPMPPMYYESGDAEGYHPAMYTGANGQLMMPAVGMLHAQHTNNAQGMLQDRILAHRLLVDRQHQQQSQQRLHSDKGLQIL